MRLAAVSIPALDAPVLERRARDLAAREAEVAPQDQVLAITFALRSLPCAVASSAVSRAVLRLGRVVAVPLTGGGERLVAMVDEEPLPVGDLAGALAGRPRPASALVSSPALILPLPSGPAAVAVDGPLDLVEARLQQVPATDLGAASDETPRLAGRLEGGGSLLEVAWLRGWIARATRP